MRYARTAAITLGIGIAIAAFAAPGADKLLPVKAEVKPWTAMAGTCTFVKKNKLEDLYDGGANVYREHGVQEAAQQLYQRGNDIMEVNILTTDTSVNAKKFYNYYKGSSKARVVIKSKKGEGFISTKNPVVGYVYTGNHLASAAPSYAGSKVQADTTFFLKALNSKLEKAGKK